MATGHGRIGPRRQGQTAVEFALVLPILLAMIVAAITGAFLYFQEEGLNNGARAASRWASIVSLNNGAAHCESGSPALIADQVQKNAPLLGVNNSTSNGTAGKLCAKSGSTTELLQGTYQANKVNIVVDTWPDYTNPQCITVNVTYVPALIQGPWGTIVMQAHSSAPTTIATGATTCPAPTKFPGAP